ncbi:MAG: type II toxin-antitoxin system Phd/YefM family antitoxin [Desulfocapsa sp.]|jgi:prevent-host-death family protein|uniref:Antitoxin n=1 Tax=Desulfotalea psychrophila TaxID=84980 RepID=A0ABS3ASP0_9BACT|nr:type II toxin-antitoxin system Phd/YefM family antitoxin [Desulfocapsa sp.]MBN4068136.1 type II toxin-antitoxin system Phd/YefM family antitoxin [Desulfotalea psychrophila]
MIENHWQLQEAKNKFSRLVEKVQHEGPQVVTKHGKDVAVVLSVEEYRKLIKPKKNLVTFFQNSPLANTTLDLNRNKELPRDIEL